MNAKAPILARRRFSYGASVSQDRFRISGGRFFWRGIGRVYRRLVSPIINRNGAPMFGRGVTRWGVKPIARRIDPNLGEGLRFNHGRHLSGHHPNLQRAGR